jgi:hypothetical protein
MKLTYANTGLSVKKVNQEYLRRNLLHASSVGVVAGLESAINRLRELKRCPRWLFLKLSTEHVKACAIATEMAKHRDEIEPYEEEK